MYALCDTFGDSHENVGGFNNEKEASSPCVELWVVHCVMYFVLMEKCFEESVCTNSEAVLNHIASWTMA